MATLNLIIATGNDNSDQRGGADNAGRGITTGVVDLAPNPNLEPGSHASADEWSVALLFAAAQLPQGATITSAILTLNANDTYDAGASVIKYFFSGQLTPAPVGLTSTNGDLSSLTRIRTTASTIATANSIVTGTDYAFDITTSIQEVCNQATWGLSSNIVVLIDTHPDTTLGEWQIFKSYGASTSLCARIVINYTSGAAARLAQPVRVGQSVKRVAFY